MPSLATMVAPYDEEYEARLRHVEKMDAVARLAGGLTQDVGNLLESASHAVRELLQEAQSALHPMHERLADLRESLQRATSVTRQLNAFARRQPVRPTLVDLGQTLVQMRPLVQRLAGPFIALEEHGDGREAWLEADFGQLEQIVLNLVANARDAMPLGGTLSVSSHRWTLHMPHAHRHGVLPAGEWTVLELRDTGEGMDAEVQAHLFEPFFTTKEPGHGTGLGLAAVYGLVRQMGGQVIVDSTPGLGSTFSVCFPAQEAPIDRLAGRGPAPDAILVVDDDVWVRTVTARILRRAGYGVLEADTASTAIDLLRDVAGSRVRLVLTDIMMGGMNGRALAQRLRTEHPSVRVVLMTGFAPEALPDDTLAPATERILSKPFSPAELLAAVR